MTGPEFESYLKGYGVATVVVAACLLVKQNPVIVEVLGAMIAGGITAYTVGYAKGMV